jgi:hypothetical protein
MADAASPYASPATVGDEPAPPRPAGRRALFLIATFATTLIGPGYLGISWSRLVTSAHLAADESLLFYVLGCAPTLLTVVWALLSDAWAIMDTRREGHLLLAALLAAIAWLVLPSSLSNGTTWTLAWGGTIVADAVASAAIGGALVEIGRRRGSTGRLAAAWVAAILLADLAATPLLTVAAKVAPGWVAGFCAALALVVVLLIGLLPEPIGEPARAVAVRPALRTYLRARTLWASAAVMACGAFASIPDNVLRADDWSTASRTTNIVAQLASCCVYALIVRRSSFAGLLRRALLLNCAMVIALIRLWDADGGAGRTVALLADGLVQGFVQVAMTDLLLRAAPDGREAFGCALLTAFYLAGSAGWKLLAEALGLSLSAATTVAALASVVAVLAVGLLPASVIARREGEPASADDRG